MNSDFDSPVNIGNPSEITILYLAELVSQLSGLETGIIHKPLPQDDPVKRCPDISLAKEILVWSPKVELKEGLKLTMEWFKNNNNV